MTAPTLTGLSSSIRFDENTVNATPQVLDMDVTFSDPDDNFDGGTLTLSGVLAEDTVSVRDQGSAAGKIGFDGTTVTYGGTAIGTLVGGAGADLTISFNADATSVAIERLIENLTYANSSDTPTTSRDFVLNVIDAAGESIPASPSFIARTGTDNPFDGIDIGLEATPSFADLDGDGDLDLLVGDYSGRLTSFESDGAGGFTAAGIVLEPHYGDIRGHYSAPSFVDLDADGDLDLVVGDKYGTLRGYANDGADGFNELWGTYDPFDGIDVGNDAIPSFVDLDADGDLDVAVVDDFGMLHSFANDGTGGFAELTGTDNPFDGIDLDTFDLPYYMDLYDFLTPRFADVDGDGDMDLVVGNGDGTLTTFENKGASGFAEMTGARDPFRDINLNTGETPSFVDLDGDGDLDLVIGNSWGKLNSFANDGAGGFTKLKGAHNPFDGMNVGRNIAPNFVDLDADGDLDLVVGNEDGTLSIFENTTPNGQGFTVAITPENDAPTATGVPSDVTVVEDVASTLDLSAMTFSAADTAEFIYFFLNASAGVMTGASSATVQVHGNSTSEILLTGTATDIDAYLNTASNIQYTGAHNVFGEDAATITLTAAGSAERVLLGTVNVDITGVNDAPALTGMGSSVTFAENTVNATPQVLDMDVTLFDPEDNFDGGTLTLSGLLAEDSVSVRDQGIAAGEIGFDGTTVTYGGTAIGTLTGGAGADLTISFNADATSVAIERLIENLTYANSSDTPTTSRDFTLNVTDATGPSSSSVAVFTPLTGADNPFAGLPFDGDDGDRMITPSFVDLDGDGDLDLVVGRYSGRLTSLENDGAGGFTELTGTDNPFDGINLGGGSNPTFVDLDADGDLDLVSGEYQGTLKSFANDGAGGFTALTGTDNPFEDINVEYYSAPSFVDLDGDGDLDLVLGNEYSTLTSFANDGAGGFAELTGTDNPFDGLDLNKYVTPSFVDLDEDGDLDLVVGNEDGTLTSFENDGAGGFTELTGAHDPFTGIAVGGHSAPIFVDLDGDGDPDLVVGNEEGTLSTYWQTSPNGQVFTVSVTPENDLPTGSGLPATVTGNEDETFGVDLSALQFSDPDGDEAFKLILRASEGRIDLAAGAGVTVRQTGTSTAVVYGTAAQLEAYLQDTGAVRYTGAQDAFGDGVATLTVVAKDGAEQATFGTINVDLIDMVDTQKGDGTSNRLSGDDGQDILIGKDGDDILIGKGGDDILTGNSGNDLIRGDKGADVLSGGAGIDMVEYSFSSAGVTVDLNADGQGFQSASGGSAEGDVLSRFESVSGSKYADVLIGDDAKNLLIGKGGKDILTGNGGNDVIRGGAGADELNGGAGADRLSGNGGNDVIRGGAGGDMLSGGAGRDTFVFNAALKPSNIDHIADFNASDGDILRLSDAHFTGLDSGALQDVNFRANLTGVAETAEDRIIYNTSTGQLFYDVDGAGGGAAVEFAVLDNQAVIEAGDIFVF